MHLQLSRTGINYVLVLSPAEASSSSVAGVVCGIAVAAIGAVAGYFTYQKKKLCFNTRQGNYDPDYLTVKLKQQFKFNMLQKCDVRASRVTALLTKKI